MAADLVNSATSNKLKEMDWTKNIEICELVARDPGQARDIIKAIKKRLTNKNSNTQLYSVLLLEMLMNNCGENIHRMVIEIGLLPILVKIVKKKSDHPVRERIFLLLDATQTSLGGASGKFPQYYAAYYDLVCAGVKFPQRSRVPPPGLPQPKVDTITLPAERSVPPRCEEVALKSQQSTPHSDSSIIQKATNALEVLREVLDAMDPHHPEGATDEFTLDLVEQCSFQKQRVMHLVMTSRDEVVVSQAIELNDQLQRVLTKHDALLSVRATSTAAAFDHEEADEEDANHLFRRIQKGKACAEDQPESFPSSLGPVLGERMHLPLIRPLSLEPSEPKAPPPLVSIPPPPAKHIERERFFKEKRVESTTLAGHLRGLSLDSFIGSSSRSASTNSSD